MSSGSVTADVYILLITFVVGFAIGCVAEYCRERWCDYRMWYQAEPKGNGNGKPPPA